MIPFSPPRIDELTLNAVKEVLLSGWITTGPKTKLFEKQITEYCGNKSTVCMGSATHALELGLRWFGVGPGDEVIVPAYTYCASANVVIHCGATPVIVDVNPHDFNISVAAVRKAITAKTKAIIPVDIAGFPCDYDELNALLVEPAVKKLFVATTEEQKALGRLLLLADAAHSFGGIYKARMSGTLADMSAFSFHAVKNLTTAEGGALALNLPEGFNHDELYRAFCVKSLHGQSKDALSKTKQGGWRYDVTEAGYKCNMTDLQAAIGLVELGRYNSETLIRRKAIIDRYHGAFAGETWAQLPITENEFKTSSFHLYQLRIKGVSEAQRDRIIDEISAMDIGVNVHFVPLPMLSFYKNKGYKIENYPVAYDNYSREISLPVYFTLTDEQVETVVYGVKKAVKSVLG